MAQQLPGIPRGTMLYNVEVLFYGSPIAANLHSIQRSVLVEYFQAWAIDIESALDCVRQFAEDQHIEIIRFLSADVAKGVVRERIVNDAAFDVTTRVMSTN